jgi:hypothetical protein
MFMSILRVDLGLEVAEVPCDSGLGLDAEPRALGPSARENLHVGCDIRVISSDFG